MRPPGISTLPSGGRFPGAGNRPSQLPGLGLGAGIGAGIVGGRDQFFNNRQDWVSDRRQDMQSRLENRQDFRNDWQENRQDFLNDRREDWQNALDDRFPWNDDWHHGYWGGDFGDYWEHMWSEHPVWSAFAVTGWSLNAVGYAFGTYGYSDPYYDASYAGAPYDYSEPLMICSDAAPSEPAGNNFDQARTAFYQGNYQQALQLTDQALKEMPSDANLHEFRGLCLFALGQYREAAATLYAVLSVGPGWDWTTMVSLYPDVDTYTAQLRKLEAYLDANPNANDARFVLAYEYLTTGYKDQAKDQLAMIVKAVPNDAVSQQLYQMLTYQAPAQPQPQPEPAAPTGPKIAVESLVGTWKAAGTANSSFEMTLTKDGSFTWKYNKGKKQQVVTGAYAVDQNTLAMQPPAGGVMLAQLTPQGNNAVDFKMIGAPDNEAPLKFTR
jgi:tetratricopeptide (TPR) repeat protein